jgi:hypothetical protein
MKSLQPLIDYAEEENIRLLIERYKDGLIILYCDKSRKREFLRQIRVNNLKNRIKIITHDYNIKFPERPILIEFDHIRGRTIKTFGKKRDIKYNLSTIGINKYKLALVGFPDASRLNFINNMKDFSNAGELKKLLSEYKIDAYVNRDRDTFIIYYRETYKEIEYADKR